MVGNGKFRLLPLQWVAKNGRRTISWEARRSETERSGRWMNHWCKFGCYQDRITSSVNEEDWTWEMRDYRNWIDCNCWKAHHGSLRLSASALLSFPPRLHCSSPKLLQVHLSLFPVMDAIFYVSEMLAIFKIYSVLNWLWAFTHAVGLYLKIHKFHPQNSVNQ